MQLATLNVPCGESQCTTVLKQNSFLSTIKASGEQRENIFSTWKAVSVFLCSFDMNMPSSPDQTDATAASTLVSFAAAII